jgi:hypothetical protein
VGRSLALLHLLGGRPASCLLSERLRFAANGAAFSRHLPSDLVLRARRIIDKRGVPCASWNSHWILEQAWTGERCWSCMQPCYERNDVCLIGLLVRPTIIGDAVYHESRTRCRTKANSAGGGLKFSSTCVFALSLLQCNWQFFSTDISFQCPSSLQQRTAA